MANSIALRTAPLTRGIKTLLKQVLPPRATIHLMGLNNYLLGESEIRELKYLVDPRRDSIDVGCARGAYAYPLRRLSRKVWCFEPLPASFAFLSAAFAKASNVAIYPIAASDADGEVTLWIPVDERTQSLNAPTVSAMNPARDASWEAIQVPARRLDSIVDSEVGFIKIDVEGHESAVLDGATKLLNRSRPNVVVEVEKRHMKQEPAAVFDRLLKLDYRGWFYWEGTLLPIERFDTAIHQRVENFNVPNRGYANNFMFTPMEYKSFPPLVGQELTARPIG